MTTMTLERPHITPTVQHPVLDVPLQQSITTLEGNFRSILAGTVTGHGAYSISDTDEGMVWGERPSIALAAGLITKYVLWLALWGYIAVGWGAGRWFLIWLIIACTHAGLRLWELRSTLYRLTSQRLEITSGLFHLRTVTYELHQLGNAVIYRPFVLRLLHAGNLTITSPMISLYGIRRPDVVRDMIRNLGQTEAGRIDKIRWR